MRPAAKMSVQLTACRRANSDFPSRGRKILIGPFSSRTGRTLHRPWNSMMHQLHDENGTKSLQLIARIQSRLYDAEPGAELYAEPRPNDCTEALIGRTTAQKPRSVEGSNQARASMSARRRH